MPDFKLVNKFKKLFFNVVEIVCFDPMDHKSKKELNRHRQHDYCKEIELEQKKQNAPTRAIGQEIYSAFDASDRVNLVRIEMMKFRSFDGATFNENTNPLVKTAIQLATQDQLQAEDSHLFHYCEKFRPQSYGELLNITFHGKIGKWSQYTDFRPWSDSRPRLAKRCGIFGPKHLSFVEHNIVRLGNLLNSIRAFSYLDNPKYIVKGYLLKFGDDERLVILEGHHRIAALAALKHLGEYTHDLIPAALGSSRSWKNCGLIYRREDVLQWPSVKSGLISPEKAEKIFDRYFFGKTGMR